VLSIVTNSLFAAGAAIAQTVAVVVASEADAAAAEYLLRQIEGGATRHATAVARDRDALLAEARQSWSERLIVVLDTERATIHVIRMWDGTALSRALDPQVARSSPYAVAVAAVELLELAGHEPAAPAPPVAPAPVAPPPPPPIEPMPAPRPMPPARTLALHATLSLGGLLSLSLGGDVVLLQPSGGLGMQLRDARSPWFFGAAAHGATFGARRRSVVPTTPIERASEIEVEYDRSEAVLRLLGGYQNSNLSAYAAGDVGAAFISTTPYIGEERSVGGRDRVALALGLAGGLRYGLGEGFALDGALGAGWLSGARSYQAAGTDAFDEGALQLRFSIGFFWESG
jgi:hypothetical protein